MTKQTTVRTNDLNGGRECCPSRPQIRERIREVCAIAGWPELAREYISRGWTARGVARELAALIQRPIC